MVLFSRNQVTCLKNLKNLASLNYLIYARSKQIKKNLEHNFVDIGKQETCVKFQQKIFKSMVVGVRASFQFIRQNTWFLENNRALSNYFEWKFALLDQFYQIIKKSFHKIQCPINQANHFNKKLVFQNF